MKRVIVVILAATAISLTAGCEKKTGQPGETSTFQADIDGSTCKLTVRPDENLLKDQKKLSREARLAAESAVEEEEPSEPTVPEEETPPETTPAPTPTPAATPETHDKRAVPSEAREAPPIRERESRLPPRTEGRR